MNDQIAIKAFLIHGVARPWTLRRATRHADNASWLEPLATYLRDRCHADVHPYYWDGRYSRMNSVSTVENCWAQMSEFFGWPGGIQGRCRNVVVAKSGGGLIVDQALDKFGQDLAEDSIDLEIRVASPIHGHRATARVVRDRVLLLSRRDQLYKWSRRIASVFPGWTEYDDPQQRVLWIPDLAHREFNSDATVELGHRSVSLFDLYAATVMGDLSCIPDLDANRGVP